MELIIDKNTKLNKIENKEDYTSLVIKTKVNPKKLNGFKNVKYLSIEYIDNNNYNYNEKHINQLPFKSNIEKISFKHIEKYGVLKRKRNEIIFNVLEYLPNLKCIEFPHCIKNVSSSYLKNINALEELIFNIEPTTNKYSTMYLYSDKLRRIIIKYFDKEYILDLDYEISAISEMNYITENNSIFIKYSNEDTITKVLINPQTDKIMINNTWDGYVHNYTLYIPDYITSLDMYRTEEIHLLSLNLNLLNTIKEYSDFIKNVEKIETIELRSNNEMSLNSSIKINIKDYGILRDIYFNNNLLHLDFYNDNKITINSKGIIKKESAKKVIEEQLQKPDLKNDTLEDLENYLSYLRLLKLSNEYDQEYKNAMEIVKDRVMKKIKK